MSETQSELQIFKAPTEDKNVEWFVNFLAGRDWITAGELLKEAGMPDTDSNRRALRAFAEASKGRVAGGQKGYKLVAEMKKVEFDHYRNWMLSQARSMEQRVVDADRIFFSRQAVPQ